MKESNQIKIKFGIQTKIFIWVMTFLVSMGISLTVWGNRINMSILDTLFAIRGKTSFQKNIIIVGIDESSFSVIKHQWPWPRSLHAQLLESLYTSGAKTVALDILFPELSHPEQDAIFSHTLKKYPQTVLASSFDVTETKILKREILVVPHPEITGNQTTTGFINLPVQENGFVRRTILETKDELSFAFQASKKYSKKILSPPGQSMILNFAGPPGTFPILSYYQALDPSNHLPVGYLKDALVFVGFITSNADMSKKIPDHFPVAWTRWNKGYMSGVEIHATAASNILLKNYILYVPVSIVFPISACLLILSAICMVKAMPKVLFAVWLSSLILCIATSLILFCKTNFYLPVVETIFPMTITSTAVWLVHMLEINREKRFVRNAFATYVAPQVVKELVENPEKLILGGEEREITALFSDIEGFTSISEKMSPKQLVTLLNEFLTEMSDIILENQGTVDKFEGDAIIAFFGAPQALPAHARQACISTIKMQKKLSHLNNKWEAQGLPRIRMRVGLNSGPAIVGNMGSRQRMDYTMMGDTVNTAARLEGVNKLYNTYSMISQTTRQALDKTFTTREIDTVKLVGKSESVTIYQLQGLDKKNPKTYLKTNNTYAAGLSNYRTMKFEMAIQQFSQVLDANPTDGPANAMMQRCIKFIEKIPGPDWDGVFQVKIK